MKYLVLILIALILFSCEQNSKSVTNIENVIYNNNLFSLTVVDTIEFDLPNNTKYNSWFKMSEIDDNQYLDVYINYNGIGLFNIDNGSTDDFLLKFDNVGPNGVGEARYIHVVNWDSIFIIKHYTTQLYLVDSSGVVINKWDLNKTISGNYIYNILATSTSQIYFVDGKVHLLNVSSNKVFSDAYWSDIKELTFDLEKNILINRVGGFPAVYKQGICYGGYNSDSYRVVTNDSEIVYSFSLDNNLYIYNDTILLKNVELRSPYVKVDAPKPQKKLTGYNHNDDWLYEIQRGSYRWMVYDKHRDIIYRLVLHAMEPYDVDGNQNKFWDKPFSIQIIDNTFNLVGEVAFPANTYDFRNIIPVKDGLLISLCHDNNPILEEDKLKLALFKLVKTNE